MSITKIVKDHIYRVILKAYGNVVPEGLVEMSNYFRVYGGIEFENKKEDGNIVAKSINFKWGTIITEARSEEEIDKKIKDSILTAFEVPSSFAPEAKVEKIGSAKNKKYALA